MPKHVSATKVMDIIFNIHTHSICDPLPPINDIFNCPFNQLRPPGYYMPCAPSTISILPSMKYTCCPACGPSYKSHAAKSHIQNFRSLNDKPRMCSMWTKLASDMVPCCMFK
ncbi:unnamed protein product [Owenia fusiformis]|uniref:Uncharacterized protein n=1 Tax=Owenia fusiformis TaxID=6347 RepID=A0A8S4N5K6_OWEFU|nr:unnamed protein product [Owenia fusiformis]